jgi:hypothetical protein
MKRDIKMSSGQEGEPVTLVGNGPSYLAKWTKREVLELAALMCVVIAIAELRISLCPWPLEWDDARYIVDIFHWRKYAMDRGLLWGVAGGWIKYLPGWYPPMVLVTGLAGSLLRPTMHAMMTAQLGWLLVFALACYGIGRTATGHLGGLFCVVVTVFISPVFSNSMAVMGEPSLFALATLVYCLVIRWGGELTPLRGLCIGTVIGLGSLTKQHFACAVIGTFLFWGVKELVFLIKNSGEQRKGQLLSFGISVGSASFIALSWYVFNWRKIIKRYSEEPPYLPHMMGDSITFSYLRDYYEVVSKSVGPIMLPIFIALSVVYVMTSVRPSQVRNWKSLLKSHAIPLALSGVGMAFFAVRTMNRNPRFIAPALIPLGLLTALYLTKQWNKKNVGLRVAVACLIVLHLSVFCAKIYGTPISLPSSLVGTVSAPISIDPLPDAIEFLRNHCEQGEGMRLITVGEDTRFSRPLVQAMLAEKRSYWRVSSLYGWPESTKELDYILPRLDTAHAVVFHETISGVIRPTLVEHTRHDKQILDWLDSEESSFAKVFDRESVRADSHIRIFRRNR